MIITNLTDGIWAGNSDKIATEAGHVIVSGPRDDADVVILGTQPISISECREYKGVVRLGAGYNNVPFAESRARGYPTVFAYTPNAPSQAVAEHALALMMMALRIQGVNRDKPGRMLSEITVGIIGRGRIGKRFAALCKAVGVQRIMAVDPVADTTFDEIHGVEHTVAEMGWMDTVLSLSDVVSLHVPVTDETTEMVVGSFLRKMKRDAILINTSRGPVVWEEDLAYHLDHFGDFIAALDVTESEPYPEDGALRQMDNCILTPHVASMTIPARQAMEREAILAAVAICDGKKPRWEIPEKEVWE